MGGPRYRASDADALRIRELDDLIAIYHRPSGQTHLVVSPVPELLAALGGEGMTADALLLDLAERYDLADGDGAALTARLDELADAGLVERA